MPSAVLLTPLVDPEQDWISGLWDDGSSLDAPIVAWQHAGAPAAGPPFDPDVVAFLTTRFAERFETLRARVRLPAEKYARLFGVSRRTLYHWLATGRPADQAIDLVEHLAAWVDELEPHLSAPELQRLLDPEVAESIGTLLVNHDFDAAAERVRVVADDASRPHRARRLDALADDPEGDPPSATVDELRAAFVAFTALRHTAARPGGESEPPELTY